MNGRHWLAVAVTASLSLTAIALSLLPAAAFHELYGLRLYPAMSSLFALLTGWTFLPLGMILLPLTVGALLWRALTRRGRPLHYRLAPAALLAVALWAGYLVAWGVNYRRPSLLELAGVPAGRPSGAEMTGLAEELAAWVSANSTAPADSVGALAVVSLELEELARLLGWPARLPGRVKQLPAGTLLRAGYAGMLFPFTLEPQIDAGLGAHSRVAIGAHELSHAAGFATEADADLAAVIAGLRADHEFARYATSLSLLARMLGSLPKPERSEIIERLPQRARSDLAEARARAARYLRPSLKARITAIYDTLLRRQGVSGGVASYGLVPRSAALARRHGLLPDPPPPPELTNRAQPATGER
jgi:hypothetical protein